MPAPPRAGSRATGGPLLSDEPAPGRLRELARRPWEHGLAALLRQCVPGRGPLPELELVRTKYKPGRALTAYYRTGQDTGGRWLAMTWAVGPAAGSGTDLEAPALQAVEAQARHRQLMAPFTRLSASDPASGVSLLVSPADPAMTQLVRLQDRSYLEELLPTLTKPPRSRQRVSSVHTVRYRPGQRHVLRADLRDELSAGTAFIKIDRDKSGARAIRCADRLGALLAAACPGATLCTPLGYVEVDHASVWAGSPGRPLSQALSTEVRAPQLVGLLGRALRFLHDNDDAPAILHGVGGQEAPRPDQAARAEAAATLRACEHIRAMVPGAGSALVSLSTQVLDQLARLPGEEPRLVHGDAKCDNVVTDGRDICLLDLDRVGWGDPAMDLGKLLADLRWWSAEVGRDVAPLVASLVAGYGPCDPARWSRARLLAVLFQLKLTARRTPLHEAGWTVRVRRGMEAAAGWDAEVQRR